MKRKCYFLVSKKKAKRGEKYVISQRMNKWKIFYVYKKEDESKLFDKGWEIWWDIFKIQIQMQKIILENFFLKNIKNKNSIEFTIPWTLIWNFIKTSLNFHVNKIFFFTQFNFPLSRQNFFFLSTFPFQ